MAFTLLSTVPLHTSSCKISSRRLPQPRRSVSKLVCSAEKSDEATCKRRSALLAGGLLVGGSIVASPQPSQAIGVLLKKENLSSRQVKELRDAMEKRATINLAKVVSGKDIDSAIRLLINDAGTYDAITKTGGLDGSIFLKEELDRPENVSLKPYVEKLMTAKVGIDKESEEVGQEGIGLADLGILGAKVATQLAWFEVKKVTTGGNAESAAVLSKAFGVAFPVSIGRVDATEPSPPGLIPPPDASPADVAEFYRKLGNKTPDEEPGYFSPKPPFYPKPAFILNSAASADSEAVESSWASANPDLYGPIKRAYDKSRRTVTRTVYEVDFVEAVTKLSLLGAKFDPVKYLKDLEVDIRT